MKVKRHTVLKLTDLEAGTAGAEKLIYAIDEDVTILENALQAADDEIRCWRTLARKALAALDNIQPTIDALRTALAGK